jgi:hypothetical protein
MEEMDADLHDHIAHARAEGIGDRRTALGIAGRMVRGLPDDTSWRGRMIARSTRKDSTPMIRSAVRVALVTTLVLLVPLVAMLFTDEASWSVPDFIMAGVLLAGVGALCELAARHPANLAYRIIATVIGVAAILAGEADDAPGLVLFGGLLILGTIALAARTAQRGG